MKDTKTNQLEIYKELKLLRGDTVQIQVCRGYHISLINMKMILYNSKHKDHQLDIVIFLMSALCLVNGEHKQIEYYAGLLVDDYMLISETISDVLDKLH